MVHQPKPAFATDKESAELVISMVIGLIFMDCMGLWCETKSKKGELYLVRYPYSTSEYCFCCWKLFQGISREMNGPFTCDYFL